MKSQRLISVDVLRGLTVALMILVNNPGSWAHIYSPLRHAAWHGWTPTDLVFPFFLFVVGVAISLSFARRLAAGTDRWHLLRKVLLRTALIFGLGLALNGFPYTHLQTLRVWGVLQRIAICYLGVGLTVVFVRGNRGRVAVLLGLVLAYEMLMRLPLVGGWGRGSFELADNFVRWVDLGWPGARHMYQADGLPFDPEGLVSTLSATAGTLAGFFAGEYLQNDKSLIQRLGRLLVVGLVLTGGGLLLGHLEPINKQLWTMSYTVLTTGLALVCLAFSGWVIDVRGWRRWFDPAIVFGSNALLAFVGSGLLARVLVLVKVTNTEGARVSLKTVLYGGIWRPLAGPLNGSLLYALATTLLWWFVLWLLYRKQIFIKI